LTLVPFALGDFRCLFAKRSARFLRQMRDGALSFRRAGGLLNISSGRAFLFSRASEPDWRLGYGATGRPPLLFIFVSVECGFAQLSWLRAIVRQQCAPGPRDGPALTARDAMPRGVASV
jgi:hypothetical protein